MSDLVGNPEDRFSHNEALIMFCSQKVKLTGCCQVCYIEALQLLELILRTFLQMFTFIRVSMKLEHARPKHGNKNPSNWKMDC